MARREPDEHQFVHRRTGHVMVAYNERLYVWGGFMELPHDEPYTVMTPSHTIYHSAIDVWVFDPLLDTWIRKMSRGDIPLQLSGACAAIHNHYMYIFGGWANEEDDFSVTTNCLWRLFLPTLKWELLNPEGDLPLACDKSACWVYENRFYVFGGFGPADDLGPIAKMKVRFVRDGVHSRGWNDQLVYYDIDTNTWVWPQTYGPRPSPRAAHTADIVGDTVYVFGGRFKNDRMNDLHCLNLTTSRWSGNLTDTRVQNAPEGRSWHTFNFIDDTKAVVYGGFNVSQQVLNDCWLMRLEQEPCFDGNCRVEWEEVPLTYDHGLPRCSHKSAIMPPGDLYIHSGLTQPFYIMMALLIDHAEEMLVLRFSPPSLQRLTFEAICRHSELLLQHMSSLPQNLQAILKFRSSSDRVT
ncbi:kelch domain-containing protein 2-like isoform X1 [Palaemon carinicauda]|uniref:kelch domain-containing protein 2-like isoform X1 n=1 Tax=Palaemon carinicauda TaxID=392227 RepID=UPI0035B65BF0